MNYNPNDIRTWAVEDNPTEKILAKGTQAMTDSELLSAILTNGYKPMDKVARAMLAQCDNNLNSVFNLSHAELMRFEGIGPKTASRMIACFELGRRLAYSTPKEKKAIKSSETVFDHMRFLSNYEHEEFWILTLNRANRIVGQHKISQGGLAGTVIDTRIILKKALDDLASCIIAIHNHPSGNMHPSDADIMITNKLVESAKIMELKLLDHVIITQNRYFSFADEGLI